MAPPPKKIMHDQKNSRTPLWLTGIFFLLFIIAGTLVYSNAFRGAFVFDDINFITKNDPNVHMTRFSLAALKTAALKGQPRHRYLPNISFAVNYYFGAENTFGYHLVNLGIHLLTGIFLFFLFQATLRLHRPPDGDEFSANKPLRSVMPEILSFGAVMLWLVHPVQTNAVTYICQRMASMVAMFYILSLLCYVRGRINFRNGRVKTAGIFFAACLVSGVCAMATKENAGTLPVFILFYEWVFFQDLNIFRSKRMVFWVLAGGIVFAAVVIYFMGADPLQRILNSYARREFTLPQRVMTEFRVVTYYVSLLFYPHPSRLILDHDYPLSHGFSDPVTTFTCFVLIIGIAGLAIYLAKKDRLVSFALFWFLGNLVIESSVIGIEIIYEHRMYLPAMFLYLAITLTVFRVVKNRWAAAGILIVCMMILSVWAHQRNRIWESEVAFWTDNVSKSPRTERPYQNLAYSLQLNNDFENAIVYYQKSLKIKPHPVAYFNLGLCLEGVGYFSDAVDAYVNALKMNYNTPQVHGSLAMALTRIGEFDAALTHFSHAARMDPADLSLKKSMASLQAFLDACREPEHCVMISIRQNPENPALRFKLGRIFEKQGKPDAAYAIYEKIRDEIGVSDRKLYRLVLNRMAVLKATGKE